MVEKEPTSSAGQRLGAPESLGISTLETGQKPPAMPAGRHIAVRVRMLDDSEEIFDISVSGSFIFYPLLYNLQSKGLDRVLVSKDSFTFYNLQKKR